MVDLLVQSTACLNERPEAVPPEPNCRELTQIAAYFRLTHSSSARDYGKRDDKRSVQEEIMKSGNSADRETSQKSDLEGRYGAVGISAVAAALPYQSDAKNSAYARIDAQADDRFVNASA